MNRTLVKTLWNLHFGNIWRLHEKTTWVLWFSVPLWHHLKGVKLVWKFSKNAKNYFWIVSVSKKGFFKLFLTLRAPTYHSFTFNSAGRDFSIFDSVLFLWKFIFSFDKKHGPLTLKCRNSIQNKNNRKATYNLAPGPLIFKLQQKVW